MMWFEGNLLDAVQQAKQNEAGLLIFVASDDDLSHAYKTALENIDLHDKICIAFQIEPNSCYHHQLNEIYHCYNVPSVLIISSRTGKILTQFDGSFDEEFSTLVRDILPEKPKIPVVTEIQIQEQLVVTEKPKIQIEKEAVVTKKPVLEKVKPVPIKRSSSCESDEETAPNEPKKARIQLKMPSGETASCIMDPNDNLGNLREKAATEFGLNSSFDLAVSYPRRILDRNQNSSTLEELSLCPTSTLLILPQNSVSSFNIITSFIGMLVAYVQNIWNRLFA